MRALAWDPEIAAEEPALLDEANAELERMDAAARVEWALGHLPGGHALSSSFGAQSAVSLHLVTRAVPSIPVIACCATIGCDIEFSMSRMSGIGVGFRPQLRSPVGSSMSATRAEAAST
jgi:hypothetical protein